MMDEDWLSLAGFVLSLALVTAPFWVVPHAADASTTYVGEGVEYGSGLDGGISVSGQIDGLDCYDDDLPRGCLFAQYVVDSGPVTVDVTRGLPIVDGKFTSERYVVASSNTPFYERNVTVLDRQDGDGRLRARYALEPVATETVLENVAVEERELPGPLRGLDDGETRTVHGVPLDVEGTLVRSGDEYLTVQVADRTGPELERWQAQLLRGGLFLVGLGMLRARWRAQPA